ncbi:hypothetical protein BV375_21195 [Nostoc sp. 106C]|nr:hypothetical protein BV375_21195 [Nostoc sp. 106C]
MTGFGSFIVWNTPRIFGIETLMPFGLVHLLPYGNAKSEQVGRSAVSTLHLLPLIDKDLFS